MYRQLSTNINLYRASSRCCWSVMASVVHKVFFFCTGERRFCLFLTSTLHLTVFIYMLCYIGNPLSCFSCVLCIFVFIILWMWAFVHALNNTIWHHMVLPGCKNTYTWVSLWCDITRHHHGEQLGEDDVWIWEVTCPCSSFWKRSWGVQVWE